ncbi:hypothetical protein [Streptomyces tsukubensis]|uniref:hypothetical protein n=1 Tax=Streptomyces tsukubensis TaxID=83656 RepID=UPI00117E870F|nr:hypothetical protein [Streptomyces tsukubensis]QFR93309.1 hypothetical protein GBW32_09665 [Streptomyces tsukubensis]
MTDTTAPRLSPACSIGECGYCPGDNVPLYAPGRRAPGEPPVMVLHRGHRCGHSGRPVAAPVPLCRASASAPPLGGAA